MQGASGSTKVICTSRVEGESDKRFRFLFHLYLHSKKSTKNFYTLNSEMNLNSAKMYLNSSKVYLNLRKRMFKF